MHVLLDEGATDWIRREGCGAACVDLAAVDEGGPGEEPGLPLRLRPGCPDRPRAYRVLRAEGVTLHVSRAVPVDAVHGLDVVSRGGRPVVRALRVERRR